MGFWMLTCIVHFIGIIQVVFPIPRGCDGYIDLVLAIDSSNSILDLAAHDDPLQEWAIHKNFLKSVVQNLPVGTSTQVSTVRYSTQANVFFHFDQYANSINVQDAIWSMNYVGGNTNTAEALRTIDADIMTHDHGERPGARDVLVILTDGLSNLNQNLTGQYAQALKIRGFEIFAVSTSREVDVTELAAIASEPLAQYLFQILNASQLETIVDTLVHRICNLPDPTESPPTENGCMVDGCLQCEDIHVCSQCDPGKYFDGAWCLDCMDQCDVCDSADICDLCAQGFYWDQSTQTCEVCSVRADIVFLLDTSGSIRDKNPADNSYDNFQLLKDFVKNLLDRIDTGPDSNRIAAIQFSNDAVLEFTLDMFQSKDEIKNGIQDIPYQGGETNTAAAIRMMREQVLLQERGDRPQFPNIGLMITDGESTREMDWTLHEADLAHQDLITMFVVGVTDQINEVELKAIASDPDENFFFNSTAIKHLDHILTNLVEHVCTPENPQSQNKRDTYSHKLGTDIISDHQSAKDHNSIQQLNFMQDNKNEDTLKDVSIDGR